MNMRLRAIFKTAAAMLLIQASPAANAEYALFDQNTDTIAFAGNTLLGTTATFEAIVSLPSATSGGTIFWEQVNAQEHKQLSVSPTGIGGIGWNWPNITTGLHGNASISLNAFHHVAYVRDGGYDRIYLDGKRVTERAVSGDIGDYPQRGHPGAIGAAQYDLSNDQVFAFLGLLDSVRISNVARYSGTSFSAPTGDFLNDANTLLLYNFDLQDVTGNTLADLSGNGHSGTFATGFTGATAPTIVAIPEPETWAMLLTGLGLVSWTMRSRKWS